MCNATLVGLIIVNIILLINFELLLNAFKILAIESQLVCVCVCVCVFCQINFFAKDKIMFLLHSTILHLSEKPAPFLCFA